MRLAETAITGQEDPKDLKLILATLGVEFFPWNGDVDRAKLSAKLCTPMDDRR
jgi:hypothetical protein